MTLIIVSTNPKARPPFYARTEYKGASFTGYGTCPWFAAWRSVQAALGWFGESV